MKKVLAHLCGIAIGTAAGILLGRHIENRSWLATPGKSWMEDDEQIHD